MVHNGIYRVSLLPPLQSSHYLLAVTSITMMACYTHIVAILGNAHWVFIVSLVDGYNLPVSITNSQGCNVASCPVDLGPNCSPFYLYAYYGQSHVSCFYLTHTGPAPLQGPYDASGFPVGCKSACDANLSGDPSNYHRMCCMNNKSLISLFRQLPQLLLG